MSYVFNDSGVLFGSITGEMGWIRVFPSDSSVFFTLRSPETKVQMYFIRGYTETDWHVLNEEKNYLDTLATVYDVNLTTGGNVLDQMPAAIREEISKKADGYEYTFFSYTDTLGAYQNIRVDDERRPGEAGRLINYADNEDKAPGAHGFSTGRNYRHTNLELTCLPTFEEFIGKPDKWVPVTEESVVPTGATIYFAIRTPRVFKVTWVYQDDVIEQELPYGAKLVQPKMPGEVENSYFSCWRTMDDEIFTTMPAKDIILFAQYEGNWVTLSWRYKNGRTYVKSYHYGDSLLKNAPVTQAADGGEVEWYTDEGYHSDTRIPEDAIITDEYEWIYGRDHAYTVVYMDGDKELDRTEVYGSQQVHPEYRSYYRAGYDLTWVLDDGTEVDKYRGFQMPDRNVTVNARWTEMVYTYDWLVRDKEGNYTRIKQVQSASVNKKIQDIKPTEAEGVPSSKVSDTRYVWRIYRVDGLMDQIDAVWLNQAETENRWKWVKNNTNLPSADTTFIIALVPRTVKVTFDYGGYTLSGSYWVAKPLYWPDGASNVYDKGHIIVGLHDDEGNVYYDGEKFGYPPYHDVHLYPDLIEHDHSWAETDRFPSTCESAGAVWYKCTSCGAAMKEDLPLLEHEFETTGKKTDATCTEPATEVYVCKNCGETKIVELSPALGHSPREDVTYANAVNATCTQPGSVDEQIVCSRCNEVLSSTTVTQKARGHSPEEIHENEAAGTCTEGGSYDKVIRCKRCGEELSREKVATAPTGHLYTTVTVEPTCTEKGFTTHTCEICGDTFTDTEKDALGHDYEAVVTPATCTEDGYTTYTCSRCGDSYKDDIVPHGDAEHVPGDSVRTEPYPVWVTDEYGNRWVESWHAGDITVKCTVCGTVISSEVIRIKPKLRKYLGEDSNSMTLSLNEELGWLEPDTTLSEIDPSMFFSPIATSGNADSEDCCDLNGMTLSFKDGSKTISALASGDKLKIHIKPQGKDAKTFEEVDITITITGSAAHVHDLVQEEAKAATCTEDGWDAYEYCTACDYTTKEIIPAFGHDLVHVDAQAATCTEAGWDAYDYCKRDGCTYTTKQGISAVGHDMTHFDAKAATCTTAGNSAYWYCSNCKKYYGSADGGEPIQENSWVINATGHNFGDWINTATCTEGGVESRSCQNPGCGVTESHPSDALGHSWGDPTIDPPKKNEDGTEWVKAGKKTKKCTECEETQEETIKVSVSISGPAVLDAIYFMGVETLADVQARYQCLDAYSVKSTYGDTTLEYGSVTWKNPGITPVDVLNAVINDGEYTLVIKPDFTEEQLKVHKTTEFSIIVRKGSGSGL